MRLTVLFLANNQYSQNIKKGVYEFLIDQYGDSEIGSYSNFKAYCKKHKLKPSKSDASGGGGTRYETDPADMAECDWL